MISLPGCTNAHVDITPAMKVYAYLNDRRGRVKLHALDAPKFEWSSLLSAFEDALKHEQKVTAAINKLVDLAIMESDHATHSFLKWFVDEQVEEEEVVDTAIQNLKRVGDFGPSIFILDRELSHKPLPIGIDEG
ncbi:MAG: ferritin [Anaerolineae bacterium]|nr:ferritin [Anaerolineae bacterium]